MFRALLAHLQEALQKRHLVYCVRVMSVGCARMGVELVSWTKLHFQQDINLATSLLTFLRTYNKIIYFCKLIGLFWLFQ
jgi:hypothetical protein